MAFEQEMHSPGGFRAKGTRNDAETVNPAEMDADRALLLRLGKKQVLKVGGLSLAPKVLIELGQRNFGLVSMTGFACSLMSTWEGAIVYATNPHNFGEKPLTNTTESSSSDMRSECTFLLCPVEYDIEVRLPAD